MIILAVSGFVMTIPMMQASVVGVLCRFRASFYRADLMIIMTIFQGVLKIVRAIMLMHAG